MISSIILLIFALLAFAGACSSGFVESYTDSNLCYSFQNKKLSFMDAEGICFGLNGHLVTVNSMFENMFLNGKFILFYSF